MSVPELLVTRDRVYPFTSDIRKRTAGSSLDTAVQTDILNRLDALEVALILSCFLAKVSMRVHAVFSESIGQSICGAKATHVEQQIKPVTQVMKRIVVYFVAVVNLFRLRQKISRLTTESHRNYSLLQRY
jgi:hypothetical protein